MRLLSIQEGMTSIQPEHFITIGSTKPIELIGKMVDMTDIVGLMEIKFGKTLLVPIMCLMETDICIIQNLGNAVIAAQIYMDVGF
jgi:uncharacterized membrane protein